MSGRPKWTLPAGGTYRFGLLYLVVGPPLAGGLGPSEPGLKPGREMAKLKPHTKSDGAHDLVRELSDSRPGGAGLDGGAPMCGVLESRYQELVDRKHLAGLSAEESGELEALRIELERLDEPFYEPILADLRARVARSRSRS